MRRGRRVLPTARLIPTAFVATRAVRYDVAVVEVPVVWVPTLG